MNRLSLIFLLGFAFLVLMDSFYVVQQTQQAIVFQFNKFVKVEKEPGLKFRLPFVQTVTYYDNRILNISADEKEFTAKDQKRLIVNAFAKYKINDPLKFYQSVYDEDGIRSKLNAVVDSSMRQIVGEVPLTAFLTDQRPKIMKRIQTIVNLKGKEFGVDVIDVRISRADLPKENSEAIYRRMQTEREREAKEFRAEGAEDAQRIIATADKDKTILLAEANKKAEKLRGEGDGVASKIYADAFSRDSEFYHFYRSMQAYVKTIKKGDTSIILSPDHEFLKYFGNSRK